jgi:hypothetical protein
LADLRITASRVRQIPLPLLIQQLIAPIAVHMMMRPAVPELSGLRVARFEDRVSLRERGHRHTAGQGLMDTWSQLRGQAASRVMISSVVSGGWKA